MQAQELFRDEFNYALSPLRETAAFEALWDNDEATVKRISDKIFTNGAFQRISSLVPNDILEAYILQLQQIIRNANRPFAVHFIGETGYPSKLLDAKYPTPLLYYSGAWDLIFSPSVAVVGTRHPTTEGIKRTQKLVKSLVEDKLTIMSGLASGIDTVAHETAIENGGNTIAVLGTSIIDQYPKENQELQAEIAAKHLLVSQVPIIKSQHQDYLKNRFFFPERNKTMSALSLGTVIVEAGETSGSLIQAKAAIEQGRKLFILDNCFRSPELTWPNKYLEKGAIRVGSYEEIRSHLLLALTCPNKSGY